MSVPRGGGWPPGAPAVERRPEGGSVLGPETGPEGGSARADLDPALVKDLLAASLAADPGARDAAVARMMAHGVRALAIARVYVPEVARRLGDLWIADDVGFADVSMASARLQGLVRDLHLGAADPMEDAPLAAVVVPQGETHTLGAVVAATHLRAAGVSVLLLMGRTDAEAVEAVRGGDLSLVCVSSSEQGRPHALRPLVRALAEAAGAPVALGGAIVCGALGPEALLAATGADIVTADLDEALRLGASRAPGG